MALWLVSLVAPAFAADTDPIEDYASYEPQTVCRSKTLPGTQVLAGWINRSFAGGTARATVRACGSGGVSEHKDGRAIDWTMSATKKRHRTIVSRFLARLRATDTEGNTDALARRMGVMYVIWNDRIYRSYRGFEPAAYRSSSCKTLRKCSPTLRHRDHVHISLSTDGAHGLTSWYVGRL